MISKKEGFSAMAVETFLFYIPFGVSLYDSLKGLIYISFFSYCTLFAVLKLSASSTIRIIVLPVFKVISFPLSS